MLGSVYLGWLVAETATDRRQAVRDYALTGLAGLVRGGGHCGSQLRLRLRLQLRLRWRLEAQRLQHVAGCAAHHQLLLIAVLRVRRAFERRGRPQPVRCLVAVQNTSENEQQLAKKHAEKESEK